MVLDIQSKEVIDKISDELKVQPAFEIPRALADKIQLVYAVNPPHIIQRKATSASDDASANMFTVSDTKNTYIIAAGLTVAKDVNATSLFSDIVVQIEGEGSGLTILRLRYEPVTVGNLSETISLSEPILVKKGSTITVTNSTAVGSIDTTGWIFYYETDPQ